MPFPRLPEKELLRQKLDNYPAINAVVCLLLYEKWFRLAFFTALLLIPVGILFVIKAWTTTPKGFDQPVKVSGLDLVQAWSLRRTAIKEAARGRFDESFYAWRVALANNPGDSSLVRGCIRHLMDHPDRRKHSGMVMGLSSWLMRLSSTNAPDLEMSIKAYETYQINDLVVYVLAPLEGKLTPVLEAAYLKALFNRGEVSRFADRWAQLKKSGTKTPDPEIGLYHTAYLIGWGSQREAAEAIPDLERAKQDPERRNLAHRLQLKVSEQLVQTDAYRQSLGFLQDHRLDTLADHAGLWQLLALTGRKAEAVQLLRSHVRPPESGEEAVILSRAYFNLGLADEARDLLKRYGPDFADSEGLWLNYASMLIQQERWEDLFEVALQLRNEGNPLRDTLNSYSHFLQGMAEAHRGHRQTASESFRQLLQAKIRNKIWELSAAETIDRLGFSDIARELLLDVQKEVPNTPEYWMLLGKTAYETKDPNLLVSSMASAYKLRPDDFTVINNFAAALLSTRQRPEQALQLTSRVLEKAPLIAAAKINHCLALLQNEKFTEAGTVLSTMNAPGLTGQELTYYHLAALEIDLRGNRVESARQHLDQIDLQYLFTTERQWLEKQRETINPPAAAPARKP
jgi:hypothetical protein